MDSFQETSDAIRITAMEKSCGQSQTLEAQYLIAADGASSRLREVKSECKGTISAPHKCLFIHLYSFLFLTQKYPTLTDGQD